MNYNTYNKEKTYIYEGEVVEVLYSRRQWNEIERQRTERQKRKFLYYMKQRLCGLLLILLGIWIPMMIQGDSITHGSDSPQLAAFYKNAERSEVQANTPQLAAGKFIIGTVYGSIWNNVNVSYCSDWMLFDVYKKEDIKRI